MAEKNFKNRLEYSAWVYRQFWPGLRFLKKHAPALPPIYSSIMNYLKQRPIPETPRKPILFWTGGDGVSGALVPLWNKKFLGQVLWVVNSSAEKRAIESLLEKPNVILVPNALDTKKLKSTIAKIGSPGWQKGRTAFYRRWGLPEEIPTFLFCGRLTPVKGLHHLVAMAERERLPIQLLVAGHPDPESCGPLAFRSLLSKLDKSKYCQTRILGRVSVQECYRLITFVDACVTLSTDPGEDFGFFPRQALALGTPLLLTRWGGFLDIQGKQPFLQSFEVRQVRGGIRPDFSSFRLADWLKEIKKLTPKKKKAWGLAFLKSHELHLRRSVQMLSSKYRQILKNKRLSSSVEFTPLGHEIYLQQLSESRHKELVRFPVQAHWQIMTGKRSESHLVRGSR